MHLSKLQMVTNVSMVVHYVSVAITGAKVVHIAREIVIDGETGETHFLLLVLQVWSQHCLLFLCDSELFPVHCLHLFKAISDVVPFKLDSLHVGLWVDDLL